jgi:hypothetical protein
VKKGFIPLACLLFLLSSAFTKHAMAQDQKAASSSNTTSSASYALTPRVDARLSTPITLHIVSDTLQNILKQVSAITGVTLQIAPEVATRRVCLQVEELPLYRFMEGLAWTTQLAWKVETDRAKKSYLLYQTQDDKEREAIRLADAQRYQAWLMNAIRDATMNALQQTMHVVPNTPLFKQHTPIGEAIPAAWAVAPLGQMLAQLTPEELQALAELSTSAVPYVGDAKAYASHIFRAVPFSSLPQNLQTLISAVGVPGRSEPIDWKNAIVGFYAANGGIDLCTITSQGEFLLNTMGAIYGIREAHLPSPFTNPDPETEAVVQQATVEFNEGLPNELQHPFLSFPGSGESHMFLPFILLRIHQLSGLPIFCDDFAATQFTLLPYLLTDRDTYTLYQALTQIAKAFAHQFLYFHGMLCGRTVSIGRDLRDEPPEAFVTKMSLWKAKKAVLSWEDLQHLGKLSEKQWYYLWDRRVAQDLQVKTQADWNSVHPQLFEAPLWNLQVLHLLASLTASQRREAESPHGLSYSKLNQAQRVRFLLCLETGLPQKEEAKEEHRSTGLYLEEQQWPGGALHMVSVTFISKEKSFRKRSWQLLVNATPTGGYDGRTY